MNFTVNEIASSVAGKPSLSECAVDELRQLTHQFPYFGPAQFLFLKKLKEENSWQLSEQMQKASLYFQNPLWFDLLLNGDWENNVAGTESVSVVNDSEKKEEPAAEIVAEMEVPMTHEEVVDQTGITAEPEPSQNSAPVPEPQPELLVEMPKFKFEPVDISKPLSFEPYHTVDYFASQGIKPKEEGDQKPKDQLSRQLKSFTEWLKVMKRLPVSEIGATVSLVDEKKVEKMAEQSISDREVVTEAMAEVWEKQGNQGKAREIYDKLSLLNPGKSSYFAAKIDHLKNL